MNYTYQELRNIAKVVCRDFLFDLECPTINFKNVYGGRANIKTWSITIPLWATKRNKQYALYYVIHELIHFRIPCRSHSQRFKDKEKEILAHYNIVPIYAKAYPKELKDLEGKKICGRQGL